MWERKLICWFIHESRLGLSFSSLFFFLLLILLCCLFFIFVVYTIIIVFLCKANLVDVTIKSLGEKKTLPPSTSSRFSSRPLVLPQQPGRPSHHRLWCNTMKYTVNGFSSSISTHTVWIMRNFGRRLTISTGRQARACHHRVALVS